MARPSARTLHARGARSPHSRHAQTQITAHYAPHASRPRLHGCKRAQRVHMPDLPPSPFSLPASHPLSRSRLYSHTLSLHLVHRLAIFPSPYRTACHHQPLSPRLHRFTLPRIQPSIRSLKDSAAFSSQHSASEHYVPSSLRCRNQEVHTTHSVRFGFRAYDYTSHSLLRCSVRSDSGSVPSAPFRKKRRSTYADHPQFIRNGDTSQPFGASGFPPLVDHPLARIS